MKTQKPVCAVTQRPVAWSQAIRADMIRPELRAYIQSEHPQFGEAAYISVKALNEYRRKYLANLIARESEEISALEKEVLDALANETLVSENLENGTDEPLTTGQRIADQVARFGGSWTFITAFFSFLLLWMIINIWVLASKPFDPYPFILLNLILSCLAAIQAPIIMMSQNRQEQKDRLRGEHDFKVNLKAELEIRLLHEKLDHLIVHQNQKLLEIQEIQTDYLEDILRHIKKG